MKNISTLSYIMYMKGTFSFVKRWGELATSLAFARLVPEKSSNWISKILSRWSGRYLPRFRQHDELENHQFFLKENHIFKWLSCCSHVSFLGCSWRGICWWGILRNRFWRRIFDILETQLEMQARKKAQFDRSHDFSGEVLGSRIPRFVKKMRLSNASLMKMEVVFHRTEQMTRPSTRFYRLQQLLSRFCWIETLKCTSLPGTALRNVNRFTLSRNWAGHFYVKSFPLKFRTATIRKTGKRYSPKKTARMLHLNILVDFFPSTQKKRKSKKNNRPLGGLQTLRPFFRWTVCAVIFRGDLGGLRGLVEGLSRALITEVVRHKDCIFCDECTAKAGRCNGGWGWGTYKGKEKPRGNNTIWGSSILVIFFWGWVGFQGIVRSRHHKSGDLFTHGWDGGIRRGLRMEKSSTSCELLQLGGIFSLSHLLHPFAWVFSNTGG